MVLVAPLSLLAQPACHNYGSENTKPNKLYLYFPASADSTYPEFGGGGYGGPNKVPIHTDARAIGPWEKFRAVIAH